MIERQAPNGTTIQFPEGTSEVDINAYLSLEKYQVQEEELQLHHPHLLHVSLGSTNPVFLSNTICFSYI